VGAFCYDKTMNIGSLNFAPLDESPGIVDKVIEDSLANTLQSNFVYTAEINPDFADTTSFCKKYDIDVGISTNCLVIEAKRADKVWYAACLVLATDAADINGTVRRQLDARKTSFAPMDTTLRLTQMEYGGITPVGLPSEWPILVDEAIMNNEVVVVGGGNRSSKIAVITDIFHSLPNAKIMKIVK
jgi:prolyl-tRNA editing enzyme YbaK/EbsC (Cys-tRNA(Pro) deacylase)